MVKSVVAQYRRHRAFRGVLITAIALFGVFGLSAVLYAFRPFPNVQRVLFFPDETTGGWAGELREVPKQKTREEEIDYVLREIVLGPTVLQFGRTLPRDTKIEMVLLRDNVLYVDLSEAPVFPHDDVIVDFRQMLAGLRKTLEYNYPMISDVLFFIDGISV